MGFTLTAAELARLLLRVLVIQHNTPQVKGPCWEWRGPVDSQGYGSIKLRGVRYFVHRVSYSAFKKDADTDGMQVDHECRNRKCVNPDHLVTKTHGQNAAEANERRWATYRAVKAAQRTDEPPF